MDCPDCGAPTVAFAVPVDLREYAPGERVALCVRCLRTHSADEAPTSPDFSRVDDRFPDGEAGVALAVALGLLGSLALNRTAIVDLCERAEREGADALLTLDRLVDAGGVEAHFDLDRRRAQLTQLLQ